MVEASGSSEAQVLRRAARYLPGGTVGNPVGDADHPIVVREGKGSRVWDVGGREYVDYLMGSGPMVLGHAHPAVVAAVVEAAQKGSTFFATHELAVALAEEIVRAVPCAETVRFTTSGTDACFQCLRVARAFTGRDNVLKFEGGYHGSSDYAAVSVTPSAHRLREFPQPVAGAGGVPRAVLETVLVAPYNDLDTTASIIERHRQDLAAVIVEPIQRVLAPEPGFLQGLREVTARYQVPLIFDEVVTGFRLAYGGAQEYYGVIPDLAALGKILGGGYPLAAVTGRAEIMAAYDPATSDPDNYVPQLGTLNGNPVSCAAGLATLAELRKEGAYQRLHATGRRLRDSLESLFQAAEIPIQPAGEDPIFGFFFAGHRVTDYRSAIRADGAMMARFNALLMEHGVLKGWPDKFYPSLAHTEEDLTLTIEALASTIEALRP